jgi:hypothetical protein
MLTTTNLLLTGSKSRLLRGYSNKYLISQKRREGSVFLREANVFQFIKS